MIGFPQGGAWAHLVGKAPEEDIPHYYEALREVRAEQARRFVKAVQQVLREIEEDS